MLSINKTLLLFLLPLFVLSACDDGSVALNYEVYRAASGDDELEYEGRVCIVIDEGSGVGGGTNEYAVRQESLPGGGTELTYLVPDAAQSPENPVDPSNEDDELTEVAVVSLGYEDLVAGEVFTVEFERPDGARFEVSHWGSADCESIDEPAP